MEQKGTRIFEVSEQALTTDMLVINTGLASCLASIRAKQRGADIIKTEEVGVSKY